MNIGVGKKNSSKNSLHEAGSSNLALCDNLNRCDGVGSAREVQEGGDICIDRANSC